MNNNFEQKRKTIGIKIKTARKAAGLTQEQLAERIGVDRSSVAKYESGAAIPSIISVSELCIALNISVNDLL